MRVTRVGRCWSAAYRSATSRVPEVEAKIWACLDERTDLRGDFAVAERRVARAAMRRRCAVVLASRRALELLGAGDDDLPVFEPAAELVVERADGRGAPVGAVPALVAVTVGEMAHHELVEPPVVLHRGVLRIVLRVVLAELVVHHRGRRHRQHAADEARRLLAVDEALARLVPHTEVRNEPSSHLVISEDAAAHGVATTARDELEVELEMLADEDQCLLLRSDTHHGAARERTRFQQLAAGLAAERFADFAMHRYLFFPSHTHLRHCRLVGRDMQSTPKAIYCQAHVLTRYLQLTHHRTRGRVIRLDLYSTAPTVREGECACDMAS